MGEAVVEVGVVIVLLSRCLVVWWTREALMAADYGGETLWVLVGDCAVVCQC